MENNEQYKFEVQENPNNNVLIIRNELDGEIGSYELNDVEYEVITDAIDRGDYVLGYLQDVSNHGCISGTVSQLIYYNDTHRFFDTHYDTIMEIVEDYEDMTGEKPMWKDDLKNWYSWFAYEHSTWKILSFIENIFEEHDIAM